jgi:Flp pilus assembly protein TadD
LTADDWFSLGLQQERAGHDEEAESAYRKALLLGGPDATRCFNLANVLYALDRKQEAAERFYQAVEIDGGEAEAWNNLANVLVDLHRFDEAKAAYEKAVQLGNHDAHYNLADLLTDLGET